MTHTSRRSLLIGSGLAVSAGLIGVGPATAQAVGADSPASALAKLMVGNRRFVAGRARHPHQSLADLHEVAKGQHPFVITLACADSRVPAELLFDQGLGDIFDNRVAGNVVDDLLLGSIEFAVEEFGVPLIMVLGHERCGAITATIDAIEKGGTAPGHIGAIVDGIRPLIEPVLHQPGDKVDNAVKANIRGQAALLSSRSEIVAEKVRDRRLRIVGARYDLDDGRVSLLP
jgi:carbonic anhydrase